jgi:hypothetical protein
LRKEPNTRKRIEVAYGWRTKPVIRKLTQGTPPIGLEESPGNVMIQPVCNKTKENENCA